MSNKKQDQRSLILSYVAEHGSITKARATILCNGYYYRNAAKYVGEILSRLVKAGILKRDKIGLYSKGDRPAGKADETTKNHPKLF